MQLEEGVAAGVDWVWERFGEEERRGWMEKLEQSEKLPGKSGRRFGLEGYLVVVAVEAGCCGCGLAEGEDGEPERLWSG